MRTVVLFRLLLIASALFVLLALFLKVTQIGLPNDLLQYKNDNAPFFGDWSGLAIYLLSVLFLISFAWAVVGLYFFRVLAKQIAVTALLLFAVLPIVRGPTIDSGWAVSFELVACGLLAAAFAMAHLAPVKDLFLHE